MHLDYNDKNPIAQYEQALRTTIRILVFVKVIVGRLIKNRS